MDTRIRSDLRRRVRTYYARHRRDLPWRHAANPYRIFVSEVMLQQTQADRVVPKYREFLRVFPNVHVLARAPLSDVLRVWQGLGYNSRAKRVHEAARILVKDHGGRVPRDPTVLETLPGIGPYTARAIAAFAWNEPTVFIETNIRTVFLHHFFPKKQDVPDTALVPLVEATLDRKHPREWYSALMDYGAHLKREYPNPSRRSAHHSRQSRFKGSDREIRGAIIRVLLEKKEGTPAGIARALGKEVPRVRGQLAALSSEGIILKKKNMRYALGS